jgi:arsenate reductase
MKTILFACVHNAGRSQIAAAWFNALSDPKAAQAISAGTQPASQVHREVITAMKEVRIDLSFARPQLLTEELARGADVLVTMGCGEACPIIPGTERQDWPVADPKGQSLEAVRTIRDEIQRRVTALLAERGWGAKITPRNGPACVYK